MTHLNQSVHQHAPDLPKDPAGEWKHKAQEYLEGWQRAKADYANLKRETAVQQAELVEYANETLLLDFLPILDHLEQAMTHVPDASRQEAWVVGLQHILREFQEALRQQGVEAIPTDGQRFDAERHEAISHEYREGVAAGTILAQSQTGYTYHGKVLRPSQVAVAADEFINRKEVN